MTKAEEIALKARIFQRLGLGPDGLCPKPGTTPIVFTAQKRRMDDASLSIMSAEEIAACQAQGVAPSDYIQTRGAVNGRGTSAVFTAQPAESPMEKLAVFVRENGGTITPVGSRDDDADEAMVESTRESLAKYEAGVGGKRNRDHLFAAQAAIQRMLKRS